ncbi:uncharacterized protein LOC110441164 [Mizuhopecten yessoensis]|uniref:uncharacterized protein LOC110441164 n=1 Tax=Mizuhopecten yessoensis TaxID=6573 RepID=UPI000B45720A|nr:uncharacterized protein LOC110441164 [Mizuhopecten yessoensis]
MEQSLGNVQPIEQTRTKNSHLDSCLSNVEEEEDNTSLSATSGEYVLGDDEDRCKHLLEIGDNMRLTSNKSGMYSEDSTGYYTDLLTLNSSVDGNTSSDTLLFQPVRLPVLQTSPIRHGRWAQLTTREGEHIFNDPINPRTKPNVTDDGYASNGYFSSLDKNSSTTQDQYGIAGLQNTVFDNTASSFVDRDVSTFHVYIAQCC